MLDDDNMEQDEYLDDYTPESPTAAKPSNEEKQKGTISADLIRGHINTIILRTLSERDKYGYEIIEEIEKKSHGQYELKQPTLYSALKRLENQGYIKAYWKTDEISAGGRRKYFTLTESGKGIAEKNRAEWEYSRTVIDNLISDQDYDFSKPAPTPIDFKILKQSTSRVPTVKLEETDENKRAEAKDNNQTVIAYSYSEVGENAINLDASQLQYSEQKTEETVNEVQDNTQQDIYQNKQPEADVTEKSPEQNGVLYNKTANNPQDNTEHYQTSENQQQPEQFYTNEIHEQQASYFRSESIEDAYGDQYEQFDEPVSNTSAPTKQEPEKPAPDSEQYKKQHENYLKLIDENYAGNGQHKKEPEYGENLDTDKLIYINRPETERDYKNLVNDIYSQTIKPQKPAYEPEPEIYEQSAPTPVVEQTPINNSYFEVISEESRQAEIDGLKIFTSDRQLKPNGRYTRNFNLGFTIFKSAAVTSIYMMIIFIITVCCRSSLGVSLVYPFVIFALACCLFAVCSIIVLSGYGRNSIKPVSNRYIGACAVLTVIAILIVCVCAILFNIDFGSAADVCKKLVIPCFTLLAVPLYSVMFYIFSK